MPPRQMVHIVDDDAAVRDAVGVLLRAHGFAVRDYCSAEAFFDCGAYEDGGCLLTDVQMRRASGLELLRRLRAAGIALPVVVMTGRAERRMAEQALDAGAAVFVNKPFAPDEIVAAIRAALDGAP